jgi:hypothetical protein
MTKAVSAQSPSCSSRKLTDENRNSSTISEPSPAPVPSSSWRRSALVPTCP